MKSEPLLRIKVAWLRREDRPPPAPPQDSEKSLASVIVLVAESSPCLARRYPRHSRRRCRDSPASGRCDGGLAGRPFCRSGWTMLNVPPEAIGQTLPSASEFSEPSRTS